MSFHSQFWLNPESSLTGRGLYTYTEIFEYTPWGLLGLIIYSFWDLF